MNATMPNVDCVSALACWKRRCDRREEFVANALAVPRNASVLCLGLLFACVGRPCCTKVTYTVHCNTFYQSLFALRCSKWKEYMFFFRPSTANTAPNGVHVHTCADTSIKYSWSFADNSFFPLSLLWFARECVLRYFFFSLVAHTKLDTNFIKLLLKLMEFFILFLFSTRRSFAHRYIGRRHRCLSFSCQTQTAVSVAAKSFFFFGTAYRIL